jgi:2-polyprenyl-3-methyl-5-hydroxy-6-metoxy-1,4-benzoquinol methylase
MKAHFIYNLLVDPVTREAIISDETGLKVVSESGKSSYEVIKGVPQIVTGNNKLPGPSEVHISQHSDFHYPEHYQADAELFDYSEDNESPATKHEIRRVHESILKEITGRGALILDAGCGNGWAAAALIPKNHRVISMDISTKNPVDSLKRTRHANHAAVTADVYNMPFREETFDYIIASEIMEHVPDPKLFIQCLLKVLKSDGKLIITTPYNEKIEYCLCVHCNRITPLHAHLHSFNENNLQQFMPAVGISYKTKTFSSKYLARLRTHVVLKYISYSLWQLADRCFLFLFGQPMRFKIVIRGQKL